MARKTSDEDILATARKRFRLAEEAEAEIRKEALDDLRFVSGKQWSDDDEQSRRIGANKRPCLTFNKLIGPLNQTANEARMNQSGIQVNPVDSASDPDTAKVIEGMIRHIEYTCKADEVYETALEQSCAGSFGYFRIVTRYCGPKSFLQEARIERVPDPFSVYIDPYAKEADKSDMMWAFEIEDIQREDYERQYPDSEVVGLNFYDGLHNSTEGWVTKSGVRIARYWCVETEKRTLQMVEWPDGARTSHYADTLPDEMPAGTRVVAGPDEKPLEREIEERHVRCYKINGVEILEQTDWPGQWIPLLYVGGKEMYVDGKRKLFSLVRFAKDPQKLYNFYRSSEAETVLLGTKAPWVGVKGAFRDGKWAHANSVNYAYLEYEPLDIAGNPAPPPQRNLFEPPIQALSLGAAQASDDIKATTGIFDASLGAQGNETSGVAIRQRQSQTGMANAHFIDNLNRAIRQCGVILCDLIPKIYDTPREVRILGEDRAQQIVKVNQQYRDEMGDHCYDLTSGQYDVTITVGPSYTTQRQETWEVLTQLTQAYPQLVQVAGDLIFDAADFPGADKIADRIRKTLPPGLADDPATGQQKTQLLSAQVQQQDQAIQQLTMALNQANEAIRTKTLELESHERIEAAKIQSSDRQAALQAQTDVITQQMKSSADAVLTANKLQSSEDIVLLREQVAALERQIARMWSGIAADESAAPPLAAPNAAAGGPQTTSQPSPASL